MKTKVDKQIKRYLKSISDKVLESKIYNSIITKEVYILDLQITFLQEMKVI